MSQATLSADEARLQLYDIMGQDVPFQVKAEEALELGRSYLGVENAHLTRIDEETDFWEAIASTDSSDGEFPPGLKLDLETTYCRRTISQESSVALNDVPNQGWADDPAFQAHGLHCYLGTTLTVDDELYGTVCFVSTDPRGEPFSDGETMFVELLSRMLEFELESDRRDAELTRRANVINVLDRVLRHNLRNDLTVIRGRVHMLADELDTVSTNSDVIFRKIEDLVKLSNTARQLDTIVNEEFEYEPINMTALGERILKSVSGDYPNTSFHLTGKEGVTLRAAPSLERAVTELIDNAAKHSPGGTTVTLSIDLEPNRVRISVSDQGPGLPEAEREVLKGKSETPLTHGSGLGLWLVYRIVAAHDGEILTDVSEEGTKVTLAIPRPEAALEAQDGGVQPEFEQVYDRFRAVFDQAFDSMVIVDNERRIMDVNESGASLVGRDQEGLIGRLLDDFVVDQEALEASWTELQQTGSALGTTDVYGAEDQIRTIEYTASRNIVPGQHLIIIRDITDRLERVATLRSTKERLDMALDATDTGVFEWPIGTDTVVWSAELEKLVGLLPGEFEGTYQAFSRRIHPADRPALEAKIQEAVESGDQYRVEFRARHEDGHYIWVEGRGKRIDTEESGKLVGIVSEITDRKEQEQDLRETKQRLESVVAISPDPIIIMDAEGQICLWNDAAEDVFGHERSEVLGRAFTDIGIIPPEKVDQFEKRLERVLAGESFSGLEVDRQTKDGKPVSLRITTAPLYNDQGEVDGLVAITEVISAGDGG